MRVAGRTFQPHHASPAEHLEPIHRLRARHLRRPVHASTHPPSPLRLFRRSGGRRDSATSPLPFFLCFPALADVMPDGAVRVSVYAGGVRLCSPSNQALHPECSEAIDCQKSFHLSRSFARPLGHSLYSRFKIQIRRPYLRFRSDAYEAKSEGMGGIGEKLGGVA